MWETFLVAASLQAAPEAAPTPHLLAKLPTVSLAGDAAVGVLCDRVYDAYVYMEFRAENPGASLKELDDAAAQNGIRCESRILALDYWGARETYKQVFARRGVLYTIRYLELRQGRELLLLQWE